MPRTESQYTDPEALTRLYRNPRNPLGGLGDGNSDPPTQTSPPPPPEPPVGGGCPAAADFVRKYISSKRGNITHAAAGSLRARVDRLWHPIEKDFHLVERVRLVDNVPCVQITAETGARARVSLSHPIIRAYKDLDGLAIGELWEQLQRGRRKSIPAIAVVGLDTRLSRIVTVEDIGLMTVVKITLASGYIFASGMDPDAMIVGHNKRDNGGPGGDGEP